MSPEDSTDDDRDTVPVGLDNELYENYLYARKIRDEAIESYTAIEDQIRARLKATCDDCDARIVVDGEPVGRWTQVVTHRFDAHAFKRQFPDIHAQFQKKSSYWRLSWAKGDR